MVSAVRFIFDHFLQTSDSWIYSSWELRIFISCKIPDKPAIQDKMMLFCNFFPWVTWTSFCAIWLQKTNFLWKVVSAVRFIFDHFLQTSDSWIYSSWELRIFISCKIPDKPAIQDKMMLFCNFFPWVTKRRMMMPWGTWKVLRKLAYFIFLSVLVQDMGR